MILANRAAMSTATTNTGTITLGTALGAVAPNVCSYQAFNSAGIVDANEVPYLILDANGNWEQGYGTYTASGTTLTRNVVYSNNSNNPINLSGNAQVFIGAIAAAGGDVLGGFPTPMRGFDAPVNLQLNASVGSNLLSIAIKGNNGSDPSATNPVYIPFRNATATSGAPDWARITSSLSISTNATGATLGSANSTAFRLWVVAFNNSGTVVLALINCSTYSAGLATIYPLNESLVASSTAISGSATSAGVFYTPNGTTVTNKAFRILGYVEYNSTGLATAGTYATAPNFVQLFGPGIKKPGDIVQGPVTGTSSSSTSTSSATYTASALTVAITPQSAANPIHVTAGGSLRQSTSAVLSTARLYRTSATTNFGTEHNLFPNTGAPMNAPCFLEGFDLPNAIASTTYGVAIKDGSTGTTLWNANTVVTQAFAWELMG